MTRRRKALFRLIALVLFFLIATRFGTMLRPSEENVRDVLNLAYDPVLLPQLQIDAVYGSALDGGAVAVYHTDISYGWQDLRPQLLNWVGGSQGARVGKQSRGSVSLLHNRVYLGRHTAWLLLGKHSDPGVAELIVTLSDGSSLRSQVHDGIFSQLVKAPQIICAMRLVDSNGTTFHVDTLNSDPSCDLPAE